MGHQNLINFQKTKAKMSFFEVYQTDIQSHFGEGGRGNLFNSSFPKALVKTFIECWRGGHDVHLSNISR